MSANRPSHTICKKICQLVCTSDQQIAPAEPTQIANLTTPAPEWLGRMSALKRLWGSSRYQPLEGGGGDHQGAVIMPG